jgi:multisubunit Na+/H+ antiporter MnhF subunit
MHLPLLGILWLAHHPDASRLQVGLLYFGEYVAYGAGVCALLLAMMKFAAGPQAAVRYAALSTLALVANYLPGFWAGALAARLGYADYFAFALLLALPGLAVTLWARRHFEEPA